MTYRWSPIGDYDILVNRTATTPVAGMPLLTIKKDPLAQIKVFNHMKPNAPLSKREERVRTYILGYFSDHGYAPTHQEVANAMDFQGINNRRQATDCILNMTRKGWLKIDPNKKHRNIIDPKKGR